jgi:hypothetical protein
MMTNISKIAAAAFACALSLQAQSNPLIAESKANYTAVKTNLIKAADKMTEEGYAFKATPDVRTFGALIGHIADSQLRSCTMAKGDMKQGTAASKTSKEDLSAALKASFAECDAAFDALTDANAMDMLKFRNAQRSRLGILIANTNHDSEEYGYLAVYMRLKGVVPPSSEPK